MGGRGQHACQCLFYGNEGARQLDQALLTDLKL
jgi:hypothetical protein